MCALQHSPETFNSVGVHITTNILASAVAYSFVIGKADISAVFIGVDCCVFVGVRIY